MLVLFFKCINIYIYVISLYHMYRWCLLDIDCIFQGRKIKIFSYYINEESLCILMHILHIFPNCQNSFSFLYCENNKKKNLNLIWLIHIYTYTYNNKYKNKIFIVSYYWCLLICIVNENKNNTLKLN